MIFFKTIIDSKCVFLKNGAFYELNGVYRFSVKLEYTSDFMSRILRKLQTKRLKAKIYAVSPKSLRHMGKIFIE